MNRYRTKFRTLILGLLGAGLIACAPGNGGASDEQSFGTVTMPLTAESPTDGNFFVQEATFSLTGPEDALITVSGDGTSRFERTIRTGTYTLHVLGSVRMQRISPEGEVEQFIAELDGPSPVFEVRKSEVTPVTVRLVSRRFAIELAESSVGEVSIGAVVTFDETAVDCVSGRVEEAHCGFNLSGVRQRSCQDGQWGPWSLCSDHHDCEEDSVEFITCVLPNGETGEIQLFCDALGQFSSAGECVAPDTSEPISPETPEQTTSQGCQDAEFEVECFDGTGRIFVSCNANDAWVVEMENSAGCAFASNPMLISASDQAHIHELGDCDLVGLEMGEVSPVECDATEEGLPMFAFQFCHDGWAYETGCAEVDEADINKMLGAAPGSPEATQPEHMPSDIPLGCPSGEHFGLTCLNDAGLTINAWVFCDGFGDETKWFVESEEGTCTHFEDSTRITFVGAEEIFESGSCDEFGMAPGDVRFHDCLDPNANNGEVAVTYCDAHHQVFMSRCAPMGDLEELTIDHCEGEVAITYAPCERHAGAISVPGIGVQTCRASEWNEECIDPNDEENSGAGLVISEEDITQWDPVQSWAGGEVWCSAEYENQHPAGTGYTAGERVRIYFHKRDNLPAVINNGLLYENPSLDDGTRSQWIIAPEDLQKNKPGQGKPPTRRPLSCNVVAT